MKIRLLSILSAAVATTLVAFTSPAAFAAPTACTGTAPSGELTAQRIVAANPTRSEPGLYEGPVWIKDALYFLSLIHI